jgi:subtilase family serine protease
MSASATNAVGDQLFQELGVQGQSFFKASGDGGAYVVNPIPWPCDNPYVTLVGGTQLTMSGIGAAYASERVWNGGLMNSSWGGNGPEDYWASGGGVSPAYPLPSYQRGISMASNGGSTVMRNLPDISMVATQIEFYSDDGSLKTFHGTSFAAPLWAGFMALVNQRAASRGLPAWGCLRWDSPIPRCMPSAPAENTPTRFMTSRSAPMAGRAARRITPP